MIREVSPGELFWEPPIDKEEQRGSQFHGRHSIQVPGVDDIHQGRRPQADGDLGVPDGGKLLVITDDGSWKVRRINNTPRVTIAKSGSLGKPKNDPVEGLARVLPKSETRRVYNAVLKRYWYHAWWFYAHSIVRGGIDKVHVGLEIEPAA